MSFSGSAATATRSANFPGAIDPTLLPSQPVACGGQMGSSSAAAKQWFTSAMAGVVIDHIVYRESKLAAVPILKDRILDRENAFWLYQHFTYREDKAKVQEILEH